MAKSKSSKTANTKSNGSAKSSAKKLQVGRGFQANPAEARTLGAFSSTEIGHVAGDVWEFLSRDGGQTVASIKKSIAAPGDVVLAAIGWLAREDKVEFSSHGRSVKISLR